jgi:excisionase family DNA binding protein
VQTTPTILTEPLLTPAEAAELLHVRPSWVYEAVRGRRLPHLRLGKHVRFERAALEEWIAAQRLPERSS